MAKKKSLMDAYLTWINKGELQARLNEVQILAKTGSDDKTIADWLRITGKEYKELKEKYPEFKRATNPKECGELLRLVKTLQRQAEGYSAHTIRKTAYVTKTGENKVQKDDTEHYYPGNPAVGIYLLEMFYGPEWNKDFNKLMAKLDKEEWSDGSSNGGNK